MNGANIIASNVDQEVLIVERLELNFGVCHRHDLVDLAVLLPADKLPMLIRELQLEANLVLEGLVLI